MKILQVNSNNPDLYTIEIAAEVLITGGLLVYPTDTSYGLGVNAYNEKAITKLYEVKGRNFFKPTHVVVADWQMIEHIAVTNELAKDLYDKFLPGPLTIILPKKKIVPDLLTSNLPTIGIRIPNNRITSLLSEQLPFPYTTPSANKSGGKTPYSVEEVKKELDIDKVNLILDAGILPPTPPSTIVDLTGKKPVILREGPIKKEEFEALKF